MPEVLEETQTYNNESQNKSHAPSQDTGKGSASLNSLNSFHFKLPVFEGPLDLLLHLIKEHKIDIYDIPIALITHQYIGYLELMKEFNLDIAGDFLVMAATLIYIKSRMLLPSDLEENEESVEDPRAELVQRLLEYQSYKDSSHHLRKREDIWKHIFTRSIPDKNAFPSEPEPFLFEANVFDLITAFKKLLEKAPEQTIEITKEKLTVTDRINYIIERVEKEDGLRFEELFEEGSARLTLIVTFLAILELVRLGLIKIYQEKAFGSIWILNPQKETVEKNPQPPLLLTNEPVKLLL